MIDNMYKAKFPILESLICSMIHGFDTDGLQAGDCTQRRTSIAQHKKRNGLAKTPSVLLVSGMSDTDPLYGFTLQRTPYCPSG